MRRRRYESRAGNYYPEPWRDVLAAYLVHKGLQWATPESRVRMLHILSDQWRDLVREKLDAQDPPPRPASEPAGCRPIDSAR